MRCVDVVSVEHRKRVIHVPVDYAFRIRTRLERVLHVRIPQFPGRKWNWFCAVLCFAMLCCDILCCAIESYYFQFSITLKQFPKSVPSALFGFKKVLMNVKLGFNLGCHKLNLEDKALQCLSDVSVGISPSGI